jgi:hypothetical protein
MSGNGGGPGGPAVPEPGPQVECALLAFKTVLSSPKAAVIRGLTKDEILKIEIRGERGPVVAVTLSGDDAGSVTAPQLVNLIRCLNEGFHYVAIVRAVRRGTCEVEIRPERL